MDVWSLFPPGSALAVDGMLTVGGCRADALALEFGTRRLSSPSRRSATARASTSASSPRAGRARANLVLRPQGVLVHGGAAGDGRGGPRDPHVAGGGQSRPRARPAPTRRCSCSTATPSRTRRSRWPSSTGSASSSSTTPTTSTWLEATVPAGRAQAVLVRVIPGVVADTHAHVLTGHDGSKFGLTPTAAAELIRRIERSPRLRMEGGGTSHADWIPRSRAVSARSVAPVAALGEFPIYDLGGGCVDTYADEPPTVGGYLDVLVGAARDQLPSGAELIIEPGRSMVASTATTLYRVNTGQARARSSPSTAGWATTSRWRCSTSASRAGDPRPRPRQRRRVGDGGRPPLRQRRRADRRDRAARSARRRPVGGAGGRALPASRWPTTTTATAAFPWCSPAAAPPGLSCGARPGPTGLPQTTDDRQRHQVSLMYPRCDAHGPTSAIPAARRPPVRGWRLLSELAHSDRRVGARARRRRQSLVSTTCASCATARSRVAASPTAGTATTSSS